MSLSKTLKAIHHTFMGTYNQLKIIVIAELHNTIRLQRKKEYLMTTLTNIAIMDMNTSAESNKPAK
jgi:type VI protein secretion system component Hcp